VASFAVTQCGAASIDYIVLTLAVVAMLFAPVPGLDDSLVGALVTALREFQSHSIYLLSLP